ncbi:MAG: hypothetical protein QOG03_2165 [Actinomycetota bacterium]|nr:hypothetical protein [Actinomycetota bacterium]
MPVERLTAAALDELEQRIDRWAAKELIESPVIAAIDHDPQRRRWYIRIRGEEKTVTTVWLTLRERTLHYETHFMPAPEENLEACYEYLLRANARLFGMRFAIGDEDAIFLMGQMPVGAVDEDELDRIVGATYAYAEQYFRPAMSIGYASKFRPQPS